MHGDLTFICFWPGCQNASQTRACVHGHATPCTVKANTARFLLSILTLLLISFSPFAHLLLPLSIVVDPFFAMMPTESRIWSGKSSIPQIVILLLPISFQIGNQIQDWQTGGCICIIHTIFTAMWRQMDPTSNYFRQPVKLGSTPNFYHYFY